MSIIKIPVKITTVVEDSIEVQLPCYTKNGYNYYSVKDEKNAVSVWVIEDNAVVSTSSPNSAFDKGFEYITKEDFEFALDKALTNIQSKKP